MMTSHLKLYDGTTRMILYARMSYSLSFDIEYGFGMKKP